MKDATGYEIAVIGMAGRFPGAENIDEYWQNLVNGVESVSFFSDEEILSESPDEPNLNHPDFVKAYAPIQGKEYFDAAFFGYTPDEATLMDPQMRILHEVVWQAMEDAGYDVSTYKQRIGLFTGAATNLNWLTYATLENQKGLVDDYSLPHISDMSYSNTRISHKLNLRGPSITATAACATSLVNIHQACNSLLLGECTMAVAGGISVANSTKKGYLYREGMIKSKDGHCRSFDKDASGTVSGDGVGVVVLKRLKKALSDNDHIYAIIRGTGINNDGAHKVSYTAPSMDGLTEAIMMARKMAIMLLPRPEIRKATRGALFLKNMMPFHRKGPD